MWYRRNFAGLTQGRENAVSPFCLQDWHSAARATMQSGARTFERRAVRTHPLLLVLVAGLGGCAPDGLTEPRTESVANASRVKPSPLVRTVAMRPGRLSDAQVKGRLGTPATHPDRWAVFPAEVASTDASLVPSQT